MIWEIPIIGDFITKPFKAAKLYEFYDRLHLFTVYLLGFFVLLTGAKQHFGNPIDCMLPKQHDGFNSVNFHKLISIFRSEIVARLHSQFLSFLWNFPIRREQWNV